MGRDGKKGGSGGRGGGAAGRGRKDKRGGRGGGGGGERLYIENIDELMLREKGRLATSDDEEDEEDNEGEEEESGEEGEQQAQTQREGEKEQEKSGAADEADQELAKAFAGKPVDPNDPNASLTRKEREALAKQKAKEDYQRRHMAGETEQARAELAKLAIVRARREAAAKKREAEGRAPGMSANGLDDDDDDLVAKQKALNTAPLSLYAAATPAPAPAVVEDPVIAAKKKAAAGEDEEETAEDGGPPLLKKIDINKMNGDTLKDHCKTRGLDIRGQKKDLMKRLIDHETERMQKIEEAKKK